MKVYVNNKLPCIQVNVHKNLIVNTLLDTGASQNFITHDLYKQLNKLKVVKSLTNWKGTMFAANNSEINVLGKCKFKIKIGAFTWREEFLVMKHDNYDMILGMPFMSNKGLIIDLEKNVCYFKYKPGKIIKLNDSLNEENESLNEILIGCSDMRQEVNELINKYQNVFTDKIGSALNLEVKLEVTDNIPVSSRPYYLSPPNLQKMKTIVDDLLAQDIIEVSTSPYSSPAFLTKKDRLVINYTELNKKLVKMDYPIGDLNNLYQHLQGARYFSVIDLNKAFLQCPLTKDSRHLTAFCTSFGKYQYKRVSFGLQVGSSVLSSYLDGLFHDINFVYLIKFLDDIVIYSKDKEDHLKHLKEVINRLSQNNLTVNVEKAKFFCREINFLGHRIKDNTICIDPERTIAIKDFPVPNTVKQVRRFVGMCGYWSRYIPRYSDICAPLHRLKRKGVKFKWSNECQEAFEKLKQHISNPPLLQLADFNKPFVLQTDASSIGAGAVLLQANDSKDLLPIAYFSRKFTDAELKYSIYEKEALSAIYAMEHFHQYLEVRKFKLITDNQALSYVLNTKRKIGRLARWVERLINLDYSVEFRHGSENILADCLSRLYAETPNEDDQITSESHQEINMILNKCKTDKKNATQNHTGTKFMNERDNRSPKSSIEDKHFCNLVDEIPLAFTQLEYQQNNDADCTKIKASITKGEHSNCYFIKNNILMYKNSKDKPRIYLPEKLFNLIFTFYHNTIFGAHFGIARTTARINEYFYHPQLNNFIAQKVKGCNICMMSKSTQRKYEGKLISITAENAMDTVYMDVLGPLVRSKKGNKYILALHDAFTRYTWLYTLKECNSKSIIEKLKWTFANFSIPKTIVTDNASYFISNQFKSYLFKHFISQRCTPAYKSSGNKTERIFRDLGAVLRSFYHDKQTEWDTELDLIQISLNTAVNSSTKSSSFKLMFNHEPSCALTNLWDIKNLISSELTLEERKENLRKAIMNARKSIQFNRNRQRFSASRTKHPFKLNCLVYVRTHYLSSKVKQFCKKLAPRYIGIFRIIHWLTDVTCLIQRTSDPIDVRKVHIIDLKLYEPG